MTRPRTLLSTARPASPAAFERALARLGSPEARAGGAEARVLAIIARSPAAPAAAAALAAAPWLVARGATVMAVFAQLGGGRGGAPLGPLARVYGEAELRRYVRLADFAGWGELHEQVHFGRVGAWTGRRLAARPANLSEGKLADFAENPRRADLCRIAFATAWMGGAPLPRRATRHAAPAAAPLPGALATAQS